ncbi:MAG: peptide chain release factor N(5)-glutamine methyltransferase [Candidatus Doudnabacteria bacterium]|nr:peptide chain release factor N(5)-glutamine methyltransferase [Candidatus Doudnabacteria bacterium]
MTIHDLINLGIKKLSTISTSPALDSEVLLSHVLDKTKEYLLTNPNKMVDPKLEKKFLTLLSRRLLGWPVAYMAKSKEFYKHKFYVDKRVLIPRPETEGLIELVLKYVKNKPQRILDIGTGSGNIIISLAKALGKRFNYFASDISPKAIAVAKKNAKLHQVKIKFADGNLLEPWGKQKFDVIVANLPYLAKLVDQSTKFEPIGALVAAKRGLKLYEELFKQISFRQLSPSAIFLEIGRDQGLAIKKLAQKILPAYEAKVYKDLSGRNRYCQLIKKTRSV